MRIEGIPKAGLGWLSRLVLLRWGTSFAYRSGASIVLAFDIRHSDGVWVGLLHTIFLAFLVGLREEKKLHCIALDREDPKALDLNMPSKHENTRCSGNKFFFFTPKLALHSMLVIYFTGDRSARVARFPFEFLPFRHISSFNAHQYAVGLNHFLRHFWFHLPKLMIAFPPPAKI